MALFGGGRGRATEHGRMAELEAVVGAIQRSQAVIEFGLDGTIITANENFLRTMGYQLSDVQGRHHSMFVDPDYARGADYQEFWRALAGGRFFSSTYRRIGQGGKEIWIQGSYNPMMDAEGKPFKVIKFATDITTAEHERTRVQAEERRTEAEQQAVVSALASALKKLADGDLTSHITADLQGRYLQIKNDFNSAITALAQTMSSIGAATGALRSGSDEIAGAADDLSRRTEQQAASLEETAAALDEITATVKRSAAGASPAAERVADARSAATNSGEVVREAVAAMGQIEGSSRQIGQIIGVIDEIAFQTNLLALNAGVEAARAGDAGRGFAVVASEVRALAQRSAEAAKEIKGLIQTSSAQVGRGVQLVGDTGQSLASIVVKVTEVDGLINEIAVSSKEQSTALAEVNTAVNQMDQVTQQNAAMVEQATAAASSLRSEAAELSSLVSRFQTGEAPAERSRSEASRLEPARAERHAPARNPVAKAQARVAAFARSGGGGSASASAAKDSWEEF